MTLVITGVLEAFLFIAIRTSLKGLDDLNSLDEFFSVVLHPLRLAFRFSIAHKFILDALFPISTPHAEFLQDCPCIREDRLTALYSAAFIIKLKQWDAKMFTNETKGYLENVEVSPPKAPEGESYAEAQTWK
jgi:hypothetical protein